MSRSICDSWQVCTVKLPTTIKNHKVLGRYEELVRELYCEPKEEVMGSFLALTTDPIPEAAKVPPRKIKKRTKQMEEPARYHDLKDSKQVDREKGIILTARHFLK